MGKDQTDFTHGDIMSKIFFRHPHLKWTSVVKNKRDRYKKEKEHIQKFTACNEFTDEHEFVHTHSHAYIETKEKMLFSQFKKMMKTKFNVKCTDLKRPVNFREVVRYITKHDKHAVVCNIPSKYTGTSYRASMYAKTHKRVDYSDYIPSTIAPCERKVFEDGVKRDNELNEFEIINERTNEDLRPWQEQVIAIVNTENTNRAVFWVYDNRGGTGKSYLCQYLLKSGNGILFADFNYRENSYLYNCESIVLFDLARSSTAPTDMRFVEDLKNGYLVSTKFEVKKKIFVSPLVIIFSNELPRQEIPSKDRWKVLEVTTSGDVIRHEHYSQEENDN